MDAQRDGRKAEDRTKYYLSPVFNIVFVLVVCGSLFFLFFRPSDLPTFRPSDLPTFRPSDLPT
ncbi:MAG TPA: hypothetical protein PLB12_10175, partial [Candidatus Goldiibacteriota bacterium]|nr:hypothetical protein [Candidatus Goldiibacteriota bacterium]